MAAQRLEKIESAPGNGRGSEAANLLDLVHGRDRPCATPDGPPERRSCFGAMLQKKAPNDLKSLDAELKSAHALRGAAGRARPAHPGRTPRCRGRRGATRRKLFLAARP